MPSDSKWSVGGWLGETSPFQRGQKEYSAERLTQLARGLEGVRLPEIRREEFRRLGESTQRAFSS